MSVYDAKPWLALYDESQPHSIVPEHNDALALFRHAVARAADQTALLYFDALLTYAELDAQSDSFAAALLDRGFERGDRLGIYLQNVPQFVIAILAAWKTGGIAVPINPMNRARELSLLLNDCTPRALVCHETLYAEVVVGLSEKPKLIFTTSALDYQTRNDPRLFAGTRRIACPGAEDLLAVLQANTGKRPNTAGGFVASDIAFLVYTSGTTGTPRGAMNTHGNVCFNAQTYRDWMRMGTGQPVLGLAPLFHITGLIGHIAAAFITAAPLVLAFRFEPGVMLDAIAEHHPAFAIGAITAFIALMNHPEASREKLASLRTVYSGGAPIPPEIVEQFRARFGLYVRNGYGLTETTSPTHIVPLGREAPVDPRSGALAIGVPEYNTHSWISDDSGNPAPVGDLGEIVISGPQVVPGYWNKPAETADAMRPDGFRTGDIGFMDADGWFYLVDRKKDMIVASGYKVWPREVEDVLYTHPAVREAAVVGVKDAYRGKTVKAVISLRPGQRATPAEIIAYCRARMAAYKYPREVLIVDDLPKTPTGKILRRELRS
jgi:long-chain acyl-CoA synthetase